VSVCAISSTSAEKPSDADKINCRAAMVGRARIAVFYVRGFVGLGLYLNRSRPGASRRVAFESGRQPDTTIIPPFR
jgi:hypothetical protein